MDVAVGIDPGSRYIGVAVARADSNAPELLAAAVLDLGEGKAHIKSVLDGRATKRRARRSTKSKKRRRRELTQLLDSCGVSDEVKEAVLAAAESRGWRAGSGTSPERILESFLRRKAVNADSVPDSVWKALADAREEGSLLYGEVLQKLRERTELGEEEIAKKVDKAAEQGKGRPHRQLVMEWMRGFFEEMLPREVAEKALAVVDSDARSHGLDNKRVGTCTLCAEEASLGKGVKRAKRTLSTRFMGLYLAGEILQAIPKSQADLRKQFVRFLAREGLPVANGNAGWKDFQRRDLAGAEKDIERVSSAWEAAKNGVEPPSGTRAVVEKLLRSAKEQADGKRAPSRLRFCPRHLRERVLDLADGRFEARRGLPGSGHSLVWGAASGKLEALLRKDVLPRLKEQCGGEPRLVRVVVERDAFDLVNIAQKKAERNRRRSRGHGHSGPDLVEVQRLSPEIYWTGPYAQIRSVFGGSSVAEWLAAELGGLCAICGGKLGDDVDRAHLVPRERVGGFPYVAVVAAHAECNRQAGKQNIVPAKTAMEALQRTVEEIERRHGAAHPWMKKKLGLMKLLVEGEPVDAERYLDKVFSTPEWTMQMGSVLANGVLRAFGASEAGGDSLVRHRSSFEVARARWALTSRDLDSPWFLKEKAREAGDATNHAMDAFVAAILPEPEVVGFRMGKPVWGVRYAKLPGSVSALESPEKWEEAIRRAWVGEPGKPIYVLEAGVRRVWDEAFAKDTPKREDNVYRKSAQAWLDGLKAKARRGNGERAKDPYEKVLEHIDELRFEALWKAVRAAAENPNRDAQLAMERAAEAFVSFLRDSTRRGLDGARTVPWVEHPVRKARIERIKRWVETGEGEIPQEIGVSVRDRASGGNAPSIEIRNPKTARRKARVNLESWARTIWLLAWIQRDGVLDVRKCKILSDGRLSDILSPEENERLAGIVHRHRPTLAPRVPEWRAELVAMLKQRGYVRAELRPGSSLERARHGVVLFGGVVKSS